LAALGLALGTALFLIINKQVLSADVLSGKTLKLIASDNLCYVFFKMKHQIELQSTKELDTLVTGVDSQGHGAAIGTELQVRDVVSLVITTENILINMECKVTLFIISLVTAFA